MMRELSLGVIGISKGNGHPYSFSAIINGYNSSGFERSDWGVIHEYLRSKDESEFGFPNVAVTHAWTQYEDETEVLCEAARIPNAARSIEALTEAVDAVVIARDDPECHLEMAVPILETGTPVFVDKPLTTSLTELTEFEPYLRSGQLMSCSGMRYARELDRVRVELGSERVKVMNGVIIKDWDRYGLHILDAVLHMVDAVPVAVEATPADHDSVAVEFDDGSILHVDALHESSFVLDLAIYTDQRAETVQLRDNFTAFRRTLYHFIQQVRNGAPAIPPETTILSIKTIAAGCRALEERDRIEIDDLTI
jgi:predicted dehydrogenase